MVVLCKRKVPKVAVARFDNNSLRNLRRAGCFRLSLPLTLFLTPIGRPHQHSSATSAAQAPHDKVRGGRVVAPCPPLAFRNDCARLLFSSLAAAVVAENAVKERACTYAKKCQAARRAQFERSFTNFPRAALGDFACSCCFESACHFSDGHDELYEYGYNCRNAHIICFKCWFALNKEQQDAGTHQLWKCPTCRVYVRLNTKLPSGIAKEGGVMWNSNKVWYLKQGKPVVIYPFNHDESDCASGDGSERGD